MCNPVLNHSIIHGRPGLVRWLGLFLSLILSAGATAQTMEILTDTVLEADFEGEVVIKADGVSLDCSGHLVFSPSPGSGHGIALDSRANVTVSNCRVNGFQRGIFVLLSSNVGLVGNLATNNVNGIVLDATEKSHVLNNTAENNSNNGVEFARSVGGLLQGNIATGNGFGMRIAVSDDNKLIRNSLNANDYQGLVISNANANRFIRNDACDNGSVDVLLISGEGNAFKANDFCLTAGF